MLKKIAFTAYPVRDMKRARAFYEGELGLALTSKPHDVWVAVVEDPEGNAVLLHQLKAPRSKS